MVEMLAAFGLIMPQLTNVLPRLTPLAASGLVILLVLASIFHIPGREYANIAFNIVLLSMSALVAYG